MSQAAPSQKYINTKAISSACLEHAGRRLAETGIQPTCTNIAKELRVSQAMVSLVAAGKRTLGYPTIAQYAERIEQPIGNLFLELTRLASEALGAPPVPARATEAESATLLDRAFEHVGVLRELIRRKSDPKPCEPSWLYETTVARGYRLFRESEVPVVALAICFRDENRWRFVVSNRDSREGTAVDDLVVRLPPNNLMRALERCLHDGETSAGGEGAVVLRPGAGAERNVTAFWEELTHQNTSFHGSKLRLFAEAASHVADASDGDGRRYPVTMLFLFEYAFLPPEAVRRTMRLLVDVVHQIHSLENSESGARVSRRRGATSHPSDWKREADRAPLHARVRNPSALRTMKRLMKRISEDARLVSQVTAAEVWSFDWIHGEFGRLLDHNRGRESNPSKNEVPETGNVPERRRGLCGRVWGPENAEWREMTGFILTARRAVILSPQCSVENQAQAKQGNKKESIVGLPLTICEEEKRGLVHCIVLYVWCEGCAAQVATEVGERILTLVGEFTNIATASSVATPDGQFGPLKLSAPGATSFEEPSWAGTSSRTT